MSSIITVGVDPGASGAIAVVEFNYLTAKPVAWQHYATPQDSKEVIPLATGMERDLDGRVPEIVVVEHVWSVGKGRGSGLQQGVSGAFSYGRSVERIAILCDYLSRLLRWPEHRLIAPKTWQRGLLDRTSGGNKKWLAEQARAFYPEAKVTLKNADALLLARYGLRLIEQEDGPQHGEEGDR